MTTNEDYRLDRAEYEDEGLCPCCHRQPSDTVDREDGHHYMKCACGKTRLEYDEEAEPEEKVYCGSCEDAEPVFTVLVYRHGTEQHGKKLDEILLCADCARDENWHVNDKGKLEC